MAIIMKKGFGYPLQTTSFSRSELLVKSLDTANFYQPIKIK